MRLRLDDCSPELKKRIQDAIRTQDRASLCSANLESTSRHEQVAKKSDTRLAPPCRISIHSVRKRLADADGVSGKAIIDGLVHAKILEDDGPKYVREVVFSQEQGKEEKTIVTIKEIA